MPALDNLGPHLLGRKPSAPDSRNYPLEVFLATDPLSQAFAALLKAHGVSKYTKAWAVEVMKVIDPTPTPTPTPPPPPPTPPSAPSGTRWADSEPTLDQGQTGHCVGFAAAQWVNTDPVDDHYTNADGDKLYYDCKVIDGEPGAEDGSTVHSAAKVLKNRSLLTTYAFASSTTSITAWLTMKGSVDVGSDWTNDMFNPDADDIIRPTGGVAGGHSYLLDEFVPAGATLPSGKVVQEDYYGLHNSWGAGWGVQGRAYISVADFATLLASQGEALAAVETA